MMKSRKTTRLGACLYRDRYLYLMLLPGVLFFLVYKYLPMWGLVISFQDYNPALGLLKSPWVGFKHFQRFFTDPSFWRLFSNTMLISLYNLVFYFPLPIMLALMLNETKSNKLKRFVQSVTYMPHFISWVVVVSITYTIFTVEGGIINNFLEEAFGFTIPFMTSSKWYRTMIIGQNIWKECGWGTIIFIAALSGIDPGLYEAADMDGANRWRKIWHITLPGIRSTIIIMLILRLGRMLDTGFEQIFLMLNAMNRGVGEVFDTYAYTAGIKQGQLSYSTVVGLFKSSVSLLLVAAANRVTKKMGEEGIY